MDMISHDDDGDDGEARDYDEQVVLCSDVGDTWDGSKCWFLMPC